MQYTCTTGVAQSIKVISKAPSIKPTGTATEDPLRDLAASILVPLGRCEGQKLFSLCFRPVRSSSPVKNIDRQERFSEINPSLQSP